MRYDGLLWCPDTPQQQLANLDPQCRCALQEQLVPQCPKDGLSNADVPGFNQLTNACDGVQDHHRFGGFPLNRQHLGRLGAVFVAARQLAFAALSNDIPTVSVVVPDLASQRLFPLLWRHDCFLDLEQDLEQNSPSRL
ncbi:hypothetical protein [Synechococcus sp. CC9902]|uniref:hypothetical protein n=1 Tax=Synechococcus sp. (strain CC9902) TaxID=316279 RepID=UPI0002E836C1|nr:hypothetical protein [Synechococcus sp. CC9902]